MVLNRRNICFGLLLVLSIIFGALFVGSSDVSAVSVGTSGFDLLHAYAGGSGYSWTNGLLYNQSVNLQYAKQYQFTTATISPTGNYASIHFETNIVANASHQQYINFVNRDYIGVLACSSSSSGSLRIQASSVSSAVTPWTDSNGRPSKTLTVYGDIALGGLDVNINQQIVCAVGSRDYAFFTTNYVANTANMYFEQNPMSILYTNNESENLLQSQIYQNQTIINQNQTMINDSQAYYDANYESIDNISGQSTSDIQGATNQQTTSLISFLGSFLTSLQSVQASNCQLTLPFPQFLGGSRTVDVCDGKQYAPSIVAVASSLLLIVTFVPLAFIVLRMIYNEIRSWTNG